MPTKLSTTSDYLRQERPGVLSFGGARMALLDIESGFWGLRHQMEALVGSRLTDLALQQAGAVGGASFARAFLDPLPAADCVSALRACLAAYQAAGFGQFTIDVLDWPSEEREGEDCGRLVVCGRDTFEAWASRRHGEVEARPACAYTAGVLVGFVTTLTGLGGVTCVERTCQACGDSACSFEVVQVSHAGGEPVLRLDPDPVLSKQLNLLEILFDRMPMGIAVIDRQFTLRRVNPTWADFIERYTPSPGARAEPGVNLFDLEPDTEETLLPIFERVFAGETVRMEAVRLEMGGLESFWDIVIVPLYEDGEVVAALDVSLDATPRVQALQELETALKELQERETRLDLVFQGTNDGIWDLDLRTDQVYFSRRWKAMLGYRDDELENELEAWRSRIHPEDRKRVLQAVEDFLAGRTSTYRLVHRLRHKDGSYRWILARGAAAYGEDGQPYRMTGSHTDITDQKKTEANLQRQAEFENLVTSISTSFINLPLAEIDAGIHEALRRIGEFTQVDRSYVFQFSGDRSTMDCTHEWTAPGVAPQAQAMRGVPVEAFAWSNAQLMSGQVLHIPRVADLPSEASAERREFQRQRIRSLLAVPMSYRSEPLGFLGFDCVHEEKSWVAADVQLLQIVGEIFVNALEHKRAQSIQAGQRQYLELLATGGEFSAILHSLVEIIEEQWPGMLGLILLMDEDGIHLHIGAAVSLPQDYLDSIEGLEIGPLVGSCGTACFTGERVIVEDILTDPRWDGLRDLAVEYGLRACWSEPVINQEGRVVGTFAMYYRQPRAPTPAELQTIETAAHLVGVAIEHQDARQALLEAHQTMEQRVAAERSRLARDLHDAVTQTLFSTSLIAEVLPRLWDKDPDEGRLRLEEIRELTRGALAEMRTLLLELRPVALEYTEIEDLLRQLIEAFRGRARLPVSLEVEQAHTLPLDVRVAVYRIAQEALNNIAKHAAASQVSVSLTADHGFAHLEVNDDGKGFESPPDGSEHLGMGIMQERAEGVGGSLEITSRPGEGTCVTFRWQDPVEEKTNDP